MADLTPIDRLRDQCWQRWTTPPPADLATSVELLTNVLSQAAEAEVETILVMNPTSRQRSLQLAVLCDDRALDDMYHQEWAELAVSSNGQLYLIYRRRDGAHYASLWDQGVTLPATLQAKVPESLAIALFDPAT